MSTEETRTDQTEYAESSADESADGAASDRSDAALANDVPAGTGDDTAQLLAAAVLPECAKYPEAYLSEDYMTIGEITPEDEADVANTSEDASDPAESGTEENSAESLDPEEQYDAWAADKQRRQAEAAENASGLTAWCQTGMEHFLVSDDGANRAWSPLNTYLALSMLAETTDGESRAQVLAALDADSLETARQRATALWDANYVDDGIAKSLLGASLWLANDLAYEDATVQTLAEDYYASVFRGEMGSDAYNTLLHDWLNEQTNGLLKESADGMAFDPATVMALATTIYFKAAWSDEFSENANTTEVFHGTDGDREVTFMNQSETDTYYWGTHFSAVRRSLEGSGSMWLILPDEGTSPEELTGDAEVLEFLATVCCGDEDGYSYEAEDEAAVIGSGDAGDTSEASGANDTAAAQYDPYANSKEILINESIPKFDVNSSIDLSEGMKALGITNVFDASVADFTPLLGSGSQGAVLSSATHAARVKIDEDGVEAAAFTMMVAAGCALPPDEEVDFVLDRPFLFVITGDTGSPLFAGIVNQVE